MIVSFHTRELLQLCSSLEMAEQLLGPQAAQLLIETLADVEAFDHVGELIDFFGSYATIDENEFAVTADRCGPLRAFCPVGAKLVRLDDGNLDWTKVRRLKLVDISKC